MYTTWDWDKDKKLYFKNALNIERFGVSKVDKNCSTPESRPLWRCEKCGREFSLSIKSTVKLPGCRLCAKEGLSSLGEEEVCYMLEEKSIVYERQKMFPDIQLGLYGGALKYDFYIKGTDAWFLLEIDGYLHYGGVQTGNLDVTICKLHDYIKDDYAKKKGINLYRIKYECDQKDLEEKLNKVLAKEDLL